MITLEQKNVNHKNKEDVECCDVKSTMIFKITNKDVDKRIFE